jgi:hypothetical protein
MSLAKDTIPLPIAIAYLIRNCNCNCPVQVPFIKFKKKAWIGAEEIGKSFQSVEVLNVAYDKSFFVLHNA